MIGVVPIIACHRGIRRRPQVTDVGQSGPPQRIEHFPTEIPGSLRTISMAFIMGLLTPQVESTHFEFPSCSPMHFCCMAQALSFRSQLMKQHSKVPLSGPRAGFEANIRPPKRYTGGPGIGGNIKQNIPA
jgi:hypothetical protein